jgi:hypothetical protein
LLGCVHYFSSAYYIGQVRFRLNGASLQNSAVSSAFA